MTRFLSFAGILTYYGFKILRFGLWLRLLEIDLARPALPLRGGRRISPPYNPPRRPAHSAGPAEVAHKIRLVVDQNFNRFLTSIFGRFWVVLGRQVGVIFGPFGDPVGPSSVQNASWKRISIKNVNFHETLRLPIPQRFLEPQDGAQNGPRSAQDGPKRLLKTIFWLLKIVFKFVSFGVSILVDFGPSKPPKT